METPIKEFERHEVDLPSILEVLKDRKGHYEAKRDDLKRQVYREALLGKSTIYQISSAEYNDGVADGIRIALDALSKLGKEFYVTEDGAKYLPSEQKYL